MSNRSSYDKSLEKERFIDNLCNNKEGGLFDKLGNNHRPKPRVYGKIFIDYGNQGFKEQSEVYSPQKRITDDNKSPQQRNNVPFTDKVHKGMGSIGDIIAEEVERREREKLKRALENKREIEKQLREKEELKEREKRLEKEREERELRLLQMQQEELRIQAENERKRELERKKGYKVTQSNDNYISPVKSENHITVTEKNEDVNKTKEKETPIQMQPSVEKEESEKEVKKIIEEPDAVGPVVKKGKKISKDRIKRGKLIMEEEGNSTEGSDEEYIYKERIVKKIPKRKAKKALPRENYGSVDKEEILEEIKKYILLDSNIKEVKGELHELKKFMIGREANQPEKQQNSNEKLPTPRSDIKVSDISKIELEDSEDERQEEILEQHMNRNRILEAANNVKSIDIAQGIMENYLRESAENYKKHSNPTVQVKNNRQQRSRSSIIEQSLPSYSKFIRNLHQGLESSVDL